MNTLKVHILALNEIKIDPAYPSELIPITGYQEEPLERSARCNGVSFVGIQSDLIEEWVFLLIV